MVVEKRVKSEYDTEWWVVTEKGNCETEVLQYYAAAISSRQA